MSDAGTAGRGASRLIGGGVVLLLAALASCSLPGTVPVGVGDRGAAAAPLEGPHAESSRLIERVAAALFNGGFHGLHGFQQGTITLTGNKPMEYARVRGIRADGRAFSVMAVRMPPGLVLYVTPLDGEDAIYSPSRCYRSTEVEGFASNCELFIHDLDHLLTTHEP